jgi:hypothetical protein
MGKLITISNLFYRCASDCTVEFGYECDGAEPTVCHEICGDGYNFGEFECDDGNEYDNDG